MMPIPSGDEPPRIDAVDEAAADRQGDERPDAARRQHPAGGERVVAEEVLRVEGQEQEARVEPEADDGHEEGAERERPVREDPQVDERVGDAKLPQHEGVSATTATTTRVMIADESNQSSRSP